MYYSIWGLDYKEFWFFFNLVVAFLWLLGVVGFYGAGSLSARLYFDFYVLDFFYAGFNLK